MNPSERITLTPSRPHANSAINTGGAAAAIQRRQTQLHAQPATPSSSSSSTVIRIERNSTFSTPGGHDRRDHRQQHHDSRQEATTNGGFVGAHSTSRIATMSMPLEENNLSKLNLLKMEYIFECYSKKLLILNQAFLKTLNPLAPIALFSITILRD